MYFVWGILYSRWFNRKCWEKWLLCMFQNIIYHAVLTIIEYGKTNLKTTYIFDICSVCCNREQRWFRLWCDSTIGIWKNSLIERIDTHICIQNSILLKLSRFVWQSRIVADPSNGKFNLILVKTGRSVNILCCKINLIAGGCRMLVLLFSSLYFFLLGL